MSIRDDLTEALTALWEADAGELLDELDVFAETRDAYIDALMPLVVAYGERCAREAARGVLNEVGPAVVGVVKSLGAAERLWQAL